MISGVFLVYFLSLSILVLGYGLGYVRIYRKAYASKSEDSFRSRNSRKKVDVVIPVKHEHALLMRKLRDIARQSYPSALLNVVVVDSSIGDACRDVVKKFSSEHPELGIAFVKDEERKGKANAINAALNRCHAEVWVITDVDVLLDENALSNLLANFDDPRVGAVSGIEVVIQGKGPVFEDLSVYRTFYNRLRIAESRIDSTLICEGELAAYKRRLLTRLPANTQCDDLNLTLNIRLQGYRAIYDPHAIFFESEGARRGIMLRQKVTRARGIIHELLRQVPIVWGRQLGDFSRIIFPFEVFLNIVAPAVLVVALVAYVCLVLDPATAVPSTAMLLLLAILAIVCTGFCSSSLGSVKDAVHNLRKGVMFLLGFVEFNAVLVCGLFLAVVRGPQASWNPIERGVENTSESSLSLPDQLSC